MLDRVTAHTDPVLHKVTGFVTRGRELLVFRHPTAGVQLPAGTVEAGETPEAARRPQGADQEIPAVASIPSRFDFAIGY